MVTTTINDYWISSSAISITLNAMGNYDYAQVGIGSNASIVAFVRGVIDYDNSHKCKSWKLTGAPTAFGDSEKKYVYVAIPRTETLENQNAIVVFPSELIDILGKNEKGEQKGSEDYYYIYLHGIISASVIGGVEKARTFDQDVLTGQLMSDYALMNRSDSEWYTYSAITGRVTFLKEIIMASSSKFLNLVADTLHAVTATITTLVLNGKTLNSVAETAADRNKADAILTPHAGGSMYLSKVDDDTAEGNMTFKGNVDVFGNLVAKGNATIGGNAIIQDNVIVEKGYVGTSAYSEISTGWRIGQNGAAVMDSMKLRRFLEVPEINYNRVSVNAGVDWKTFGGGVIESVTMSAGTVMIDGVLEDYEGIIKLKLEDGEVGTVAKNDLCMGIFHSEDPTKNETETEDDHHGNFKFKGFMTVYFRVIAMCSATGDIDHPDSRNQYFLFQPREADEHWTSVADPQAGMSFACYANPTNATRQANVYQALDYSIMLVNMTTWEYDTDNIMYVVGNLNHFTINITDAQGEVHPMQMEGYGIAFGNAYMWGHIEQVNRDRYIVSQQSYYYASNDTQSVVTQQWKDKTLTIADFGAQPLVPSATAQYVYIVWKYNYSSGEPVYSEPACSSVYGSAGLGVSQVKDYYKLSATDAVPTPLPVLRVDKKAVTNYNGWATSSPAPNDDTPYLFSVDIITFTDGTMALGNPHCAGTKGTNGKDGVDAAQPNMYGYDCEIQTTGTCLKYPIHTYNGFAMVFHGATIGEHTIWIDLERLNAQRKYAIHGTMFCPFNLDGMKLECMLADADKEIVSSGNVTMFGQAERRFVLNLTPDKVCRYVGFTLRKGDDESVRGLVTMADFKVEDVTEIGGDSTLYVGLKADTIPVGQNLLEHSFDFRSSEWNNLDLEGTTLIEKALQGANAVHYTGGARIDSEQYGNVNILYYYVMLKPNTIYTLSWYQRGNGVIYTYINFGSADDSPIVYDCKRATLGINSHLMTERWERHSMTVVTGSSTQGAYIRFSVESAYNITGNEYYLSMIKLEECERMTDYQRNENDRQGAEGMEGCVTRPCGVWREDVVYVNQSGIKPATATDTRYIDIVLYRNASGGYYKYKRNLNTEGYAAGIAPTDSRYWVQANDFDFVATDVFMADEAWINHLTGKSMYVTDSNGQVQAGMQSVSNNQTPQIFAGAKQNDAKNAPYRVMSDGSFYAEDATMEGIVKAKAYEHQLGKWTYGFTRASTYQKCCFLGVPGYKVGALIDAEGYITQSEAQAVGVAKVNTFVGDIYSVKDDFTADREDPDFGHAYIKCLPPAWKYPYREIILSAAYATHMGHSTIHAVKQDQYGDYDIAGTVLNALSDRIVAMVSFDREEDFWGEGQVRTHYGVALEGSLIYLGRTNVVRLVSMPCQLSEDENVSEDNPQYFKWVIVSATNTYWMEGFGTNPNTGRRECWRIQPNGVYHNVAQIGD